MVVVWSFVEPMVERAFPSVSPDVDVSWEGVLESWDHVVEGKGVGGQVHPSGVGGEETQCLSWPQTVVFVPHGDIRLSLAHVSGKIFNIQFP